MGTRDGAGGEPAKAEKLVARAYGRVLARHGVTSSLSFEELMLEAFAEVGVLIDRRLKRRARKLRRAWEQSGGIDREFRGLDVARSGLSLADLPLGHPEHPSNDL